jgi:hypothetical protein
MICLMVSFWIRSPSIELEEEHRKFRRAMVVVVGASYDEGKCQWLLYCIYETTLSWKSYILYFHDELVLPLIDTPSVPNCRSFQLFFKIQTMSCLARIIKILQRFMAPDRYAKKIGLMNNLLIPLFLNIWHCWLFTPTLSVNIYWIS